MGEDLKFRCEACDGTGKVQAEQGVYKDCICCQATGYDFWEMADKIDRLDAQIYRLEAGLKGEHPARE